MLPINWLSLPWRECCGSPGYADSHTEFHTLLDIALPNEESRKDLKKFLVFNGFPVNPHDCHIYTGPTQPQWENHPGKYEILFDVPNRLADAARRLLSLKYAQDEIIDSWMRVLECHAS